MIPDKETNNVYFSGLLKTDTSYSETTNQIIKILEAHGINYNFLPNTKDIWVRDYMPIQNNENTYIEYRYDPDYLQGHEKGYRDLKTYTDLVCDSLHLKTQKSDLIMDGGNLVKSTDCIILTDKVVKENRHSYSKKELIKKLHDTFQVEKVVLIPRTNRTSMVMQMACFGSLTTIQF